MNTQARRPELSLDDLARKSCAELEALYRGGSLPASLRAVDGKLTGRMLAVRGLGSGPLAKGLRKLAASRAFVWGGKSFEAESDRAGRGINRVQAPGVLGRQNLFPFTTLFAASAIDGKPAIVLDYAHPENPPYIRAIHDEIREVAPGLYLGPAMWKTAKGPRTVLWFALDTGKR
ncbi:MAG: hypothetical protein HS104_18405 [Polyangiaceae bacterium]|nr:hypothetical protein [Polyangiaceae bacterium]MCE7892805.1 hypothetical protein [Sorangiineae bacterium PRO1]